MSRQSIHSVLLGVFGILTLSLFSCCRGPELCSSGCTTDVTNPLDVKAGNLRVTGILKGYRDGTEDVTYRWKDRDAIGLTATALSDPSYTADNLDLFGNIKYTTLTSMGNHFTAATVGVYLPDDMDFQVAAYYAHQQLPDGAEVLTITRAVAEEMYVSDLVKPITSQSDETVLTFRPLLTKLILRLSGVSLREGNVVLSGTAAEGSLCLTDNSFIPSDRSDDLTADIRLTDGKDKGEVTFSLLPEQNLQGKKLKITSYDYTYDYTFPDELLTSAGDVIIVNIVLKEGAPDVSIEVGGSVIDPMTDETADGDATGEVQ